MYCIVIVYPRKLNSTKYNFEENRAWERRKMRRKKRKKWKEKEKGQSSKIGKKQQSANEGGEV